MASWRNPTKPGRNLAVLHRTLVLAVGGALVVTSCGGSALSMSDYSAEIAGLIQDVDGRLDEHAAELFSNPPDLDATRAFLADKVAGYRELVSGVESIDPPDQVADLHRTLHEVLEELLAAEESRAAFADTVDSTDALDQVWDGPEGQAVRDAEQKAIVLCYAAQERFDDTAERQVFADVPWMPAELKEVVRVAFGCPE